MLTGYADFEIDIQPGDGKVFPFSVRSPGGEANGLLRLPTCEPLYQQLADRLAALDTDEDLLDRLGQLLFDALIQGKVKEVYNRSQGTLQDRERQGLRIKLCIAPSATEVAALPWEFLHDPDQIGPLALLDAPVVRYIPLPTIVPTLKTKLPLRVLLTGAQTAPQTDVERELREVRETLAVLGDYVQITFEPHLTPALLQRRLREGFDVWHFVGHGGFSADGATSQLLLENGRDAHSISAIELGILLNRSGVRLIVLDTCDSARLATDPFRSLAPALVRAQIPAVVAMQFKVPEETTRVFAKTFYQALAEGFPIETCMTEGRKGVMNAVGLGRADWGIPVAYTRAPDGILFDLPAPLTATIRGTIVSRATPDGAVAAAIGVHDPAGTLLSAPPPLSIKRIGQVPAAPRRQRNFLNREREQQQLQGELQPGGGAWVYGPRGCGLSSLLNQAAASPAARTLPDGIPWVAGEVEPPHVDDIIQRLFSRFYTTSVTTRVDAGMARTYLGSLQALFVLDGLPLSHADLLRLTGEVLPNSAVLVAADDAAPNTLLGLQLQGLPRSEAIKLCAAEAQLDIGQSDLRALLERLCAALDDLPLPLLLIGRLARARSVSPAQLVAVLEEMTVRKARVVERAVGQATVQPNSLRHVSGDQYSASEALTRAVSLVLQALNEDERSLLAGVVVGRPDVSLAQLTESSLLPAPTAETMLTGLADLGLITRGADRYAIATISLRHVLDLLLQPKQARSRAAAFFAGAAALRASDLSWLGRERGNIAEAIRTLLAEGQAAQAGALAKAIQPVMVLRGQWGGWGDIIARAGEAAQQSGDRALEAWVLHERGTRAGLLGDRATASKALKRALRLRKQLRDQAGIAATRRNMTYLDIFPPVPPKTLWRNRLRRYRRKIVAGSVGALLSAVGISIVLGNLVPVLVDDRATTQEDTPVAIAVIDNDTGRIDEIDPASVRVVAAPTHGTTSIEPASGRITYVPKRDFSGADHFTYQACDGRQKCAAASVVVTVKPVNDSPATNDDVARTNEDTPVEIDALANDTDIEDGHPAVIEVGATSEKGGTLAISGMKVKYTPPANFNGADRFAYTAIDSNAGRVAGTAIVNVEPVNDAPTFTKGPDQSVDEDAGPQTVEWAHNISPGPPDEASQSPTFEVANSNPDLFAAQPTIDPTGKLTYTPLPDRSGAATVTVTLHDNGGTNNGGLDVSAPQRFVITIKPVNDKPVADDDAARAIEDTPLAIKTATLVGNDHDSDGDKLAITATSAQSAKGGAVGLSVDTITYTPAKDFNGEDRFTYTVGDGNGGTASATVTIAVAPVNDNPIAVDDLKNTDEDTPLTIPGAELTGNDRDPDGDNLLVSAVSAQSDRGGTVTLMEGTATYTPPANFSGDDTFTYTVSDGSGSATGKVVVAVKHVNHSPVAVADSVKGVEDQPLTIPTADLRRNDSDRDKDSLAVTAVSAQSAKGGTLSLSGDTITYRPAKDFNGEDKFTYTVGDGNGGTASATVTIAVAPVNDPPVAKNDAATTNEATPITLDVLKNDNDPENGINPASVQLTAGPQHGKAVPDGKGRIVYTPGALTAYPYPVVNYIGPDSFTYQVCDTGAPKLCAKAIVTISVRDVTAPPAPVPIAPVSTKISCGTTCSLRWAAVSDASGIDRYEWILEAQTATNTFSIVSSGSTGKTSTNIDVPCGAYRWRVRAVDRTGNVGLYSSYAGFRILCPVP